MNEVTKHFLFILGLFLLMGAVVRAYTYGLDSFYLPAYTRLERKTFEESYQRQAGLEAKVATLEAQAAKIRRLLTNPDLAGPERTNLESQLDAIEVQITSAKTQMNGVVP